MSRAVCESAREQDLVAFLYHEDSASERESFERHLEDCSACRRELSELRRVRDDLGAWQVEPAPRLEIALKRRKLEVLGELIGLFPVWVRAVSATAAAAATLLVAFSIAGANIDLRAGSVSFGYSGGFSEPEASTSVVAPAGAPGSGDRGPLLTRAEIETMIADRVAEARAEQDALLAQREKEMRAQLTRLSAELSTVNQSQARLKATIATLRAEQRAILARGQVTLGEWLFAGNGSREQWGTENEQDN